MIEEQKPNVNASLMITIKTMSQQDKEKLPMQLTQSGDIVNQACKAACGDEVRRFEVATDNDEEDGEISDESEGTVIIVKSKEEEEKEKDDITSQSGELNNESNENNSVIREKFMMIMMGI